MSDKRIGGWQGLVVCLALSYGAAALGSAWTARSVETWYPTLRKPAWTPPNQVFGPVWSLLYTTIGIAGWLVVRAAGRSAAPRGQVRLALGVWLVQLVLNAAWSGMFFGLRQIGLGLGTIAALWASIAACVALFARVSAPAAWLMVPYWLWVSLAAALNAAIWRLNGDD